MKKVFSILFFLCLASNVSAQSISQGWHGSWGFQSPQEKANVLNQAMAFEFVENGGFTTTSTNNYFQQQHCGADGSCFNSATAIGTNVVIAGNNNEVEAGNTGNVSGQNNKGRGEISNQQAGRGIWNRQTSTDNTLTQNNEGEGQITDQKGGYNYIYKDSNNNNTRGAR